MLLDQDAARAGVAEIQHEINLDGDMTGGEAHQFDPRQCFGGLEQAEHDLIARVMPAAEHAVGFP